jgi:hypothetical protein
MTTFEGFQAKRLKENEKKITFHTLKLLKYANIKMTMVALDGMPQRVSTKVCLMFTNFLMFCL